MNHRHSRYGRRFRKWAPTKLPFKKGNKRAEKILDQLRGAYNIYGGLIENEALACESDKETLTMVKRPTNPDDMLFADYMLYWLSYKGTEVGPITYAGYCNSVENFISLFQETEGDVKQKREQQLFVTMRIFMRYWGRQQEERRLFGNP